MQAIHKHSASNPAAAETDGRTAPLVLERWLPFRLFMIATRSGDLLNNYYGPEFELNRAAWRTLAVIASLPRASVQDICRAGDLDQFTVSRAINPLVERGYVRR